MRSSPQEPAYTNEIAPVEKFSHVRSTRVHPASPDAREAAPLVSLAVIVPVWNEQEAIAQCLPALLADESYGEIVVVDGGSTDGTRARLAAMRAEAGSRLKVLDSPRRGRAVQMNAGAHRARAEVLLFLHADTMLPTGGAQALRSTLARGGRCWGRFDVRLSGTHPMFRVIERLMNLRSALTGIATGDQAIFVRREAFVAAGGYPAQPLMEDIELSRRLKRLCGRPARVRLPVVTSSRRWERHGIARTILLMWWLRLLYWFGVSPWRLARWYEN
jgi:rSAM/selenodomain-associated transferase 2